jgi:hypothetical protein
MCPHRVLACSLMTALMTGHASAQAPGVHGFRDLETRLAMRLAVEGAATRIARPSCQDLFTDFDDASGQPLSTKLAKSGKSPLEAFGSLQFFDARGVPECRNRNNARVLAFTQAGASAIFVCGDRFKRAFLWNPTWTEIVVIHEFLHALGLGENPPTSQAITAQVNIRCGD